MKKFVVNIVFVAVIVVVTWNVQAQWFPSTIVETTTDTVYVDRPYEVEVIKQVEKPITVTRYIPETDTVRDVIVETDTVYVKTDTNTYGYHSSFLTQYPETHRFLGLVKSTNKLSLTTQSPDGVVDTNTWVVGNKDYRIGSNVGLETSRPKLSYDVYGEAGWMQLYEYGTPYIEAVGTLQIYGFDITTSVNINKHPFVKIGTRIKL